MSKKKALRIIKPWLVRPVSFDLPKNKLVIMTNPLHWNRRRNSVSGYGKKSVIENKTAFKNNSWQIRVEMKTIRAKPKRELNVLNAREFIVFGALHCSFTDNRVNRLPLLLYMHAFIITFYIWNCIVPYCGMTRRKTRSLRWHSGLLRIEHRHIF